MIKMSYGMKMTMIELTSDDIVDKTILHNKATYIKDNIEIYLNIFGDRLDVVCNKNEYFNSMITMGKPTTIIELTDLLKMNGFIKVPH
jgi:hypothetical protein